MATEHVDRQTWDEFHRLVNMTSRQLEDFLREEYAGAEAEELPDQSGTGLGRHVLAILGKRETDLTPDDITTMRQVIGDIRRERGADPDDDSDDFEPTAGDARWRHRLMGIGHDPLAELRS